MATLKLCFGWQACCLYAGCTHGHKQSRQGALHVINRLTQHFTAPRAADTARSETGVQLRARSLSCEMPNVSKVADLDMQSVVSA
jgi:hypothetical protein